MPCARVLLWGTAAAAADDDDDDGIDMDERGQPQGGMRGPLAEFVDARDRWFRTPLQWAVCGAVWQCGVAVMIMSVVGGVVVGGGGGGGGGVACVGGGGVVVDVVVIVIGVAAVVFDF